MIARVTIAGGVAKITKLAQGMLDLHSARGRVELEVRIAAELRVRLLGRPTEHRAVEGGGGSRVGGHEIDPAGRSGSV
ncbi:MAG: hypothetical protein HC774_07300 [Sphingomonadales bacterium]|nr:hypothetical protein [Sphingomonadales bacterium]